MPTANKTQSSSIPEIPFSKQVPWPWNHVPTAGIPTRQKCQSLVTDSERAAGVKLVSDYRDQEAISLLHNIEAYQVHLDKLPSSTHGVAKARLNEAIRAADHGKYLAAEDKLSELRAEAFKLAELILKRVAANYDTELN